MGSVLVNHWSPTRSVAGLSARHLDTGVSWRLELSGEADVATMSLLWHELAEMATIRRADLVVDVTGLTFCDVASAELCLAAERTCALTVTGAKGSVKRVFGLLDALRARTLPPPRTPTAVGSRQMRAPSGSGRRRALTQASPAPPGRSLGPGRSTPRQPETVRLLAPGSGGGALGRADGAGRFVLADRDP
jgi:hypothetical protein